MVVSGNSTIFRHNIVASGRVRPKPQNSEVHQVFQVHIICVDLKHTKSKERYAIRPGSLTDQRRAACMYVLSLNSPVLLGKDVNKGVREVSLDDSSQPAAKAVVLNPPNQGHP